jgi:hypothetical protein
VAALELSPGIPNRIEVMGPPVALMAKTESRKDRATLGFLPYATGIRIAIAATPPIPGKIPTITPMTTARNIQRKVVGLKTFKIPCTAASNTPNLLTLFLFR